MLLVVEAGAKADGADLDMTINDVMDEATFDHIQVAFEALGAGEKKV